MVSDMARRSDHTREEIREMALQAAEEIVVEKGDVVVALDRELDMLDLERVRAEEAQASSELEDSRRRLAEAERVGPERGIPETQIKSLRAEVVRDEAALTAAAAP